MLRIFIGVYPPCTPDCAVAFGEVTAAPAASAPNSRRDIPLIVMAKRPSTVLPGPLHTRKLAYKRRIPPKENAYRAASLKFPGNLMPRKTALVLAVLRL